MPVSFQEDVLPAVNVTRAKHALKICATLELKGPLNLFSGWQTGALCNVIGRKTCHTNVCLSATMKMWKPSWHNYKLNLPQRCVSGDHDETKNQWEKWSWSCRRRRKISHSTTRSTNKSGHEMGAGPAWLYLESWGANSLLQSTPWANK